MCQCRHQLLVFVIVCMNEFTVMCATYSHIIIIFTRMCLVGCSCSVCVCLALKMEFCCDMSRVANLYAINNYVLKTPICRLNVFTCPLILSDSHTSLQFAIINIVSVVVLTVQLLSRVSSNFNRVNSHLNL